jgi:hypothetical protein
VEGTASPGEAVPSTGASASREAGDARERIPEKAGSI